MRTLTFLALLGLAIASAAPSIAQTQANSTGDGHRIAGAGTQHHAPRAFGLAENDTFRHLTPDQAQRGMDKANRSNLFGPFTYSGGKATGRFVSFQWSDASGAFTDLTNTKLGETIFSTVQISPWQMENASEAHGAVFHARGMDQFVSVHNDPTIGLHIQTDDTETNVTFTLAPTEHINANATTDRVLVLTDAAGAHHGHLVLLGNATATNASGVITVHLGPDDGVLFLAHPGGDAAAANGLHAAIDAASKGHLGTVLDVSDDGSGTPVEDELPLSAHAAATHVEPGKVELTVSSDTTEGKTIVVHLPTDTISAGGVRVTISGEAFDATNATGQDVKAALATLQASGKGAIVSFAANGTEVIVQVPHFSDQPVTIQQVSSSGEPGTTSPTPSGAASSGSNGTPGFEAALLAIGLGAAGVLRRRRA